MQNIHNMSVIRYNINIDITLFEYIKYQRIYTRSLASRVYDEHQKIFQKKYFKNKKELVEDKCLLISIRC